MPSMWPWSRSSRRAASHSSLRSRQHELEPASEVVEVLAGVVEVHDLGGRELGGGDVPGGAVAEDGELADVAAADAVQLAVRAKGAIMPSRRHPSGRTRRESSPSRH